MPRLQTTPFDGAKYITEPEHVMELLNDALESGEPGYIAAALGAIVRSEAMTRIAAKKRQALYRSLSEDGNPTLETLLGVLGAMNLQLAVKESSAKAA